MVGSFLGAKLPWVSQTKEIGFATTTWREQGGLYIGDHQEKDDKMLRKFIIFCLIR